MTIWGSVWDSQIELNETFIAWLKTLSYEVTLNRLLIIIIIIWLLILTYKLFKKQQKTV